MLKHYFRLGLTGLLLVLVVSACTLGASDDAQVEQPAIEGPPVVRITSPTANATYYENMDVNISARVENAGPDIARIEIRLDGELLGEAASPNATGAAIFTIEQGWTSQLGQHTISVTAFRGDGTSSTPAEVTINVIAQDTGDSGDSGDTGAAVDTEDSGSDAGADVEPTNVPSGPPPSDNDTSSQTDTQDTGSDSQSQSDLPTPVPTHTPTATVQPTDTPVPPSPTPSVPTGRITVGVNVRTGPSVAFSPPMGGLQANTEVELLAKNSEPPTWYKITFWNGEGWVASDYIEVIGGNVGALPIDPGPPTPVPTNTPTNTPVPSPVPQVNLVPVNIQTSPHPLVCNQSSEIQVTLRNEGSAATSSGGLVRVYAILISSNQVLEETTTAFGALAAGEQVTVSAFLTVSVNHSEGQRIIIELDSNNQIAESSETDNTLQDADYILQKGSCP